MKTTIETITPQQAAKWLEPKYNRDNRAMRQAHVEFLSQQILDGKWQTTHQGVAFAKSGRLLDGQHRLAAIVRSGKAVQIQVSTGMDEDAFQVTDCGLKRAHFDRLHLVDEPSENRTICTVISYFLRDTTWRGETIPVSAIEDTFLGMDGKFTESWIWIGREWRVRGKLGLAAVLASMAVYHLVNPPKAMEFNDGYRTGANLKATSPILALQRTVMNNSGRVDYWVAQAAMRQHLIDRNFSSAENGLRIFAASEDMLGNKNSIRVIRARAEARVKAAVTRRGKKDAHV